MPLSCGRRTCLEPRTDSSTITQVSAVYSAGSGLPCRERIPFSCAPLLAYLESLNLSLANKAVWLHQD